MISLVQPDDNVVIVVYAVINSFPIFISLSIIGERQNTIYFTAFHNYRPIVLTTLCWNRVLLTLFWNDLLTYDKILILGKNNVCICKSARNLSTNIYGLWNVKFFLRFVPNINFVKLKRRVQNPVKHLNEN